MLRDVVIVGAGLAGLMAARQLQAAGKSVTVLDKGSSVGGRLATRRIGEGLADHGAQFFTVRTAEFQQQVDDWLARDVVYVWGHGWSDGSLKRTPKDGHPRYVTRGGMNQLAKDLAQGIDDIRVDTRVTRLESVKDGIQVTMSGGDALVSSLVILTPPAPQAYDLTKNLSYTAADRKVLDRIEYGPCLAGMFVIDGAVNLPEPGALQDFERTVYWIADNHAKGISDERIVTAHAGTQFSRDHYDAPAEDIAERLREGIAEFLADDATVTDVQIKRWRYSVPITTHPHDYYVCETLPLLYAGDAFGGRGRVEGAYMSGLAAGKAAAELV